ncbi:MAG TPA: hypothetical protein VF471_03750 [Pseudoxanthomonas sp.]
MPNLPARVNEVLVTDTTDTPPIYALIAEPMYSRRIALGPPRTEV